MKKTIIKRGLFGFPMGLAIGYVISIITSLCFAEGYYSPCVPEFTAAMGSEISAVILQALLCGLIGVSFSACSVVWDMESISLILQTGIYFAVNALVMISVAYVTFWMEHSLKGFLGYLGIFILTFALFWIMGIIGGRRSVKKMNESLYQVKNSGGNRAE